MEKNIKLKKSLCRYYLRGLCKFTKEECDFAHGTRDLDYRPREIGEEIQYDFLKQTEFTQRNTFKGPCNYVNLYEFQHEKKYSLQQLNNDKQLRVQVRNLMHQQLFHDFMNILEEIFPQANFTEDFIHQEYTRVGFNKLMTRIKFSHMTDALCQGQNPRYFMKALVMPPLVKQTQNFLFKRPPNKEIIDCYRLQCEKILKENESLLDQAELKKKIFNKSYFGKHFPTLSQILKERKITFSQFLKGTNYNQESELLKKVSLEPTPEVIVMVACKYLESNESSLVSWNSVFAFLSKELKINNGNILNHIKANLVLKGYYFLYFPMIQIITKQDHSFAFKTEADLVCKCSFKRPFDISFIEQEVQLHHCSLKQGESVDINDWSSLIKYAKHILGSKTLGVDLEGRLRKGGYVETVQLSNGRNTFLIDCYDLSIKKDFKTLQLAKKILRNIFVDKKILKVFHDCRHDSIALHECLQTCILHIFDTSAVETLKTQIQAYDKVKTSENPLKLAKNSIIQCTNVRTLGLNEIYRRYQATHGVNKNKDRFHKMWKEGKVDFFLERPMNSDYRDYCIRDVVDLPEVEEKMMRSLPEWCMEVVEWVSGCYVAFGFENSGAAQTAGKNVTK